MNLFLCCSVLFLLHSGVKCQMPFGMGMGMGMNMNMNFGGGSGFGMGFGMGGGAGGGSGGGGGGSAGDGGSGGMGMGMGMGMGKRRRRSIQAQPDNIVPLAIALKKTNFSSECLNIFVCQVAVNSNPFSFLGRDIVDYYSIGTFTCPELNVAKRFYQSGKTNKRFEWCRGQVPNCALRDVDLLNSALAVYS